MTPAIGDLPIGESPTAIAERIAAFRQHLLDAGHPQARLIAVSKGHDVSALRAAVDAGQWEFGESYAAEFTAKAAELPGEVCWHFIGQLQTNKVRRVCGPAAWVHTVDRPSLVDKLAALDTPPQVLIQVNVSGQAGRGGTDWDSVEPLVSLAADAGLAVRGLMGVAPGPGASRDEVRSAFRRISTLNGTLGLPELSIGMSQDWRDALEFGATMLRLGTAIFGDRSG